MESRALQLPDGSNNYGAQDREWSRVDQVRFRQEAESCLVVLMTTLRFEPNYITIARQVVFKAMYETFASVSTQVVCVTMVISHGNAAKTHACKTAKGIMDAHQVPLSTSLLQILVTLMSALLSKRKLVESEVRHKNYFTLKTIIYRSLLALSRLKVTAPSMLYTTSPLKTTWNKWGNMSLSKKKTN